MSVESLSVPRTDAFHRIYARLTLTTLTFAAIWTSLFGLGFVRAWAGRHLVGADGISYVDMAIAISQGHWSEAINGYWSPLYPTLLGLLLRVIRPEPAHHAAVAHGLSFLIFLMACAGFHFFWSSLMHRGRVDRRPQNSESQWLTGAGYALFAWASIDLITLERVGPDLLLTVWLYLAAGLLVRIRDRRGGRWIHALLGLVLALGFLTKTVGFMLAAPFFVVAWIIDPNRKAWTRTAVALAVFAAVCGPFITALSIQKDRLTIGDCGRIAYALYVSGASSAYRWNDVEGDNPLFGWNGQVAGLGTPLHGKLVLQTHPRCEVFAGPVGGSYPFWYDPSYWYDGLKASWNPSGQRQAFAVSVTTLGELAGENWPILMALATIAVGLSNPWTWLRSLVSYWWLVVPAIAGIALFATILIVPRYIACMLVLIGSALLASFRLRTGMTGAWPARVAGALVAACIVWPVVVDSGAAFRQVAMDIRRRTDSCPNPAATIAAEMAELDIGPGDRVGHIGKALKNWSYWASVADVKIAAEVRPPSEFWSLSPSRQQQIIQQIHEAAGIKAMIARHVPPEALAAGWRQVGNTEFFIYKVPPV